MQFGYFTLSDNHYKDNDREPNRFIADILDEAVYAEEVGLHSAWIGEHHFSTPSIELAARLGCNLIVAPFAAAMTFGGLRGVAEVYAETCERHGNKPGRLMCSYFMHFADDPKTEEAARARQIRYYRECAAP